MFFKKYIGAGLLSVLATASGAQEFVGGTLGLEYTSFDGADATSYTGEVEFAINRQFGVELNWNGASSDGETASRATLHGIYHMSNTSSVGAFYGQSVGGDVDASFYGIEGGTLLGGFSVGGYIGREDIDGTDATTFGLNAEVPVYNAFELYFDSDLAFVDDVWAGTSEIGVQYNMSNGPEFFAHFGSLTASDGTTTASEDYIGVGARINFGAKRGTTFEGR